MGEIRWSEKSSADLQSIFEYISKDSKIYATRFIKSLINSTIRLKAMPRCGRIVPELADYNFTGLGVSFGAGLTNVTLAYMASPLMSFSIGRGGDWVDEQAAKSTGLTKERITAVKEKVSSLNNQVTVGSPEGALNIYYDALISYAIEHIKKRLAHITPPDVAFPVAVAGGSSLPKGFFELFQKKISTSKLGIELSKVVRAKDPLNSVARGCLIAAQTQEAQPKKAQQQQAQTQQTAKGKTQKSKK